MKHVFGMNVVEPALKILEKQSDLSECRDYGKKIAERIR